MTDSTQERKSSGRMVNEGSHPKHLMDTSHVSATPSDPDRFKIEIRTDTVTNTEIALEGFVSLRLKRIGHDTYTTNLLSKTRSSKSHRNSFIA